MESYSVVLAAHLALFRELLQCDGTIYSWEYSSEGNLIYTNSPHPVFNTVFEHTGCLAYAVRYAGTETRPLVLSAPLGVIWCVAVQPMESTHSIHVIGPVLNSHISHSTMEKAMRHSNAPLEWRTSFADLIMSLPVVNVTSLLLYALQLHYCLTGEHLRRSDVAFQQEEVGLVNGAVPETVPQDRYQTYMAEKALLDCVREGKLDYKSTIDRAASLGSGVRVHSDQPMGQVIITITSFIGLCVRAAIEGGLSPDTAYTVGDHYIQTAMECRSIAEVGAISHTMLEDFIRRVHKIHTNPRLSRHIQSCCDMIEMNLEKPLSLEHLAQQVGYSGYYLSRKFKQETGVSVGSYIRLSRVRRACTLLLTTDLPISEIAAMLQFCSSTHFSNTFRQVMGVLPQQYRKGSVP